MFKDSNIRYEIAERTRTIGSGGIGVIHKLVCKLKLGREINRNRVLLKRQKTKRIVKSAVSRQKLSLPRREYDPI